jgi:hypothetical protein
MKGSSEGGGLQERDVETPARLRCSQQTLLLDHVSLEPLYKITHGSMFTSCNGLDDVQGSAKSADCDEANLFGVLRDATRRRFDAMNFSSFNCKIENATLVS